jgi:DNA ligase-1
MARQPGSGYSAGRSWSLLKIKRFHDAEARVVEHQEGTGKHMGRLGALLVELADGTRFAVGTGFTDAEREDPPAVGSLITFRYQELSTGGVPRFPSFVRLRTDDVELRMPEVVHPIAIQVSRPMPPRPPPPEPLRGVLRLEFTVGSAVRFWEVEVQGAVQLVRYGKEGQPPHQQEQHFEDEEEALRATWHLIGQKKEKGYVEVEL